MAPIVIATLSSSSTTSRLPFAMVGRASDRQRDAERRTPPFATTELDGPAMRLDDALRDPEPKARALFVLGREERLEDVWQVLFGDALACVANLNVNRIRHQELGVGSVRDAR